MKKNQKKHLNIIALRIRLEKKNCRAINRIINKQGDSCFEEQLLKKKCKIILQENMKKYVNEDLVHAIVHFHFTCLQLSTINGDKIVILE